MRTQRGMQKLLLSTVAISALAGCGTAFAETAEPQSAVDTILEEIVVGAGVPKVAIDTPQAVTVLDQEAIDDRQASTVGDVLRDIPGVSVIGSDRIAGQSFNIRGIGGLAAADESKIIVTVDGAVKFYEQYRLGSFFSEPELYKRVEVLRGPASSTLYGAGAIGGVINFTTKDGRDFLKDGKSAAVRLKGSYDSNVDGFLGSVIAAYAFNERTDILISGNFRRAGEYKNGEGTSIPGSDFSSLSGLAKITHRFGENDEQSIRLSYQRWQSDADDTAYSQTGTVDAFGEVDRDITDQTFAFHYENPASGNPFLNLKLNITYSDTSVEQTNAEFARFGSMWSDSEYAYRTWSGKLENTFEQTGDSFRNYLTLGTQISHQTRVAETVRGSLGFHPEGTDTKYGFFLQNEFIWNDKLTITPGARVDFVSLDPDSSIAGASSKEDVAFSPKLAVLYQFNETFGVFGSVAHTERVPTLDELFSTSGPGRSSYPGGRSASLDLDKETSNNFEAGFTVSTYGLATGSDSLQFKGTGYYNDLKDMISTNPDRRNRSAVPYYVNIDKAEIYGFELEAAYDSDYVFGSLALNAIRGLDQPHLSGPV